jgi:hypothetical protein
MTPRNVATWCILVGATQAQAQTAVVAPELWDRPRSARAVLAEPAARQSVQGYLAQPAARIVIRHAQNPASMLEAEELRSWLVALAVEPERIALAGDLKAGAALSIEVVTGR